MRRHKGQTVLISPPTCVASIAVGVCQSLAVCLCLLPVEGRICEMLPLYERLSALNLC